MVGVLRRHTGRRRRTGPGSRATAPAAAATVAEPNTVAAAVGTGTAAAAVAEPVTQPFPEPVAVAFAEPVRLAQRAAVDGPVLGSSVLGTSVDIAVRRVQLQRTRPGTVGLRSTWPGSGVLSGPGMAR